MLRRSRHLLLTLAVLAVVFLSALVLIARRFEPRVKATLVKAINERLVAPVSVRDMDLTLIARFPMAGLRLHDVLAMEVRSDEVTPDTLLYAKELYLEFSPWGLFRGNYTIERIHAEQVDLRPGLDRNGRENFLIWKEGEADADQIIALERVSFSQLAVRYHDAASGTWLQGHSRSLELTGRFSSAMNALMVEGDLDLRTWEQGGEPVLADRQGHLRLDLSFGGEDGAFRITRGEVHTGGMPLEVTMELLMRDPGRPLELRANGLDLPIASVLALLPASMTAPLAGHKVEGRADLAVRYAGPLDGAGPALSIGAKVNKGRVRELRSGTQFKDIAGELALDLDARGTPSRILVRGFRATSGSGHIAGNWESTGLTNAPVQADLHVDIALADLLRFVRVDTLEQVGGRLKADATVNGRLREMSGFKATDLGALRMEGQAALRNATLKLKGVRHRVEQLDADLALSGNDATVNGLRATVQGNRLEMRGTLRNLVPYLLFDDQLLTIDAEATSPRLDLASLLLSDAPTGNSERPYELHLPITIGLELRARVDELVFEDFKATAINGTLRMRDGVLRVSPVTFNTAGGAVLGSLELDARGGQAGMHRLAIDATLKDMDIRQLFREFRDFGQDFIGHRHLSGTAQARVELRAPLSRDLGLDMQRLVCTVDIAVENGGIKDHAPLLEVADHLRKNRLVSPFVNTDELRRRLADVRFARLENRIDIRDGAVHIPAMEVRSSALDIELSGTHWFDDRIDHHLNFRLGELFRMGKPQRDEFGPIIDDGTGMRIFLHMYGTADAPQFANDRAMAADRRRQQFQQEKQELRSILREELGLFRGKEGTASTTERPASTTTAPRFEVEWGGPDSVKAPARDAAKPRKGLGKLLDKEQPKEERVRFQVED